MLALLLVGIAGMVCVVSLGESPKVMNEDTSGGNWIRLSCLSLLGIAEGSNVGCDVIGGDIIGGAIAGECRDDCEMGSVWGAWVTVGFGSSRSELRRAIVDIGWSACIPNPTALEEFGIFLTCPTVSIPAAANLTFAFSLSVRNLSLSLFRCALCDRCFSISFHNCEFCDTYTSASS